MSTNTRNVERSTVRPRYIPLGVDTEGVHHVYRTSDETVFAITPGGSVEHRVDVHGRHVDEWMAYVRSERGWSTQEYYTDLGQLVADHIRGGV